MSRAILFVIALILLVAGCSWFLSRHAAEQPTRPLESEVTANAETK